MSTLEQTQPRERSIPLFTLWSLSIVILLAALGVSGYLSYLKLEPEQTAACLESGQFDCGTVLNSIYSEIQGVPIAWLGFSLNVMMLSLLLLEKQVGFFEAYAPTFVFGIVLFAFIFSVYLVYVQAELIKAYCPWCLTHEALITALFVVSVLRVWNRLQEDEG